MIATAQTPAVGMSVAVKEFSDEIISLPGQLERIRQEAEIGARIKHRNVVKSHRLIEQDGCVLLILEWIDGVTLCDWLPGQQVLAWETIKDMARKLVSAVQALHTAEVLHRDLKSENVMVRPEGEPVVMDVGVAELTNPEHTLHTRAADFLGTTRYASPQYLAGEQFSKADDVYSLGGVLYHLVTGEEIYEPEARKPLLAYRVMTTRPTVDDKLRPGVPPGIGILVEACLAHDRARRPTLEEIDATLENPDQSDFLSKESQIRRHEQHGFEVVDVADSGNTLFARVSNYVRVGTSYRVVRNHVVSVGVDRIIAQKWIADVELKHTSNGIGHFAVKKKRWVQSDSAFGAFAAGSYVDVDRQSDHPRVNDRIVSTSNT